MGSKTSISWTESTWTPIRARVKENAAQIAREKGLLSLLPILKPGKVGPHCERVSPGCQRCYSETNNGRCLPNNGTGLPFNRQSRDLVDIFLDENILDQPLYWKRPRKVFVCSQTDLFGEFVPDAIIDQCFAVMAMCPQHTFQCLTKRAERMHEYMTKLDTRRRVGLRIDELVRTMKIPSEGLPFPIEIRPGSSEESPSFWAAWPLENLWLGVSCEDQPRADERLSLLLKTPAALRWASYEPALGPIDFNKRECLIDKRRFKYTLGNYLDFIVAGGESGPGARPSELAWYRSVRDQCKETGTFFFMKQLGAHPMTRIGADQALIPFRVKDRKGGNMDEWPEDLRIREFPQERILK